MGEVRSYIQAGTGAAEAIEPRGPALRRQAAGHDRQRLPAAAERGHPGRYPAGGEHPGRPAPGPAHPGPPGHPGGGQADAQRPVQHPLGDDPGHHHLGGQQPQPRGHYCPGKGHPQHHPGGAGLPGRLRRPDRGAGCRHRLLHPGPRRRHPPADRLPHLLPPAGGGGRAGNARPHHALPHRDGAGFELLANCFGPEDIGSALKLGAAGGGAAAQRLPDPGRQRLRRAGAVLLLRRLHRGGGGQAHHRPHLRFRVGPHPLQRLQRGPVRPSGDAGHPVQPAAAPPVRKPDPRPAAGRHHRPACGSCSPW